MSTHFDPDTAMAVLEATRGDEVRQLYLDAEAELRALDARGDLTEAELRALDARGDLTEDEVQRVFANLKRRQNELLHLACREFIDSAIQTALLVFKTRH